jgi:ribosomal protein S18 acetylase RimI-like enzyme
MPKSPTSQSPTSKSPALPKSSTVSGSARVPAASTFTAVSASSGSSASAISSTAPAVPTKPIQVISADLTLSSHAAAVLALLDDYAKDPAGGGQGLSDYAKSNLISAMKSRGSMFSVLAYDGEQAVGLINAIEGFSTFACKPLVNLHDVTVLASHRGQGIAKQMMARVADIARKRGAVKLTLEVLAGNTPALKAYQDFGFEGYELDPAMGRAQFMQLML